MFHQWFHKNCFTSSDPHRDIYYFDILYDICSDILSDIRSDILSGKSSGILSDSYILTFFLVSICKFSLACIRVQACLAASRAGGGGDQEQEGVAPSSKSRDPMRPSPGEQKQHPHHPHHPPTIHKGFTLPIGCRRHLLVSSGRSNLSPFWRLGLQSSTTLPAERDVPGKTWGI